MAPGRQEAAAQWGSAPVWALRDTIQSVRALAAFFRANPQALVLLIICVVLGLGTFLAVVFSIASSGSTTTNGYPSDAIFGLNALMRLVGP